LTDKAQDETLGLPIKTGVCFSTARSKFSNRVMKRQLKTLEPMVAVLKQFLEPDEIILLAVRGRSPVSTLETLSTGWTIYYARRCVLVVTSKRILHIPTRANFRPKRSIAEVRYGDIAMLTFPTFLSRALALKYKSGKRERFSAIPSGEFKKLKVVLDALPKEGPTSEAGERRHLCPKCMSPLRKDTYACPTCRLEFKSRRQAVRRALLLPGGGWFYTGYPMLGVLYALIEVLLLVDIMLSLGEILAGVGGEKEWVQIIVSGGLLALEKSLAVLHARRSVEDYIPVGEDFVPIKSHAR
jgi:hypothetical protein